MPNVSRFRHGISGGESPAGGGACPSGVDEQRDAPLIVWSPTVTPCSRYLRSQILRSQSDSYYKSSARYQRSMKTVMHNTHRNQLTATFYGMLRNQVNSIAEFWRKQQNPLENFNAKQFVAHSAAGRTTSQERPCPAMCRSATRSSRDRRCRESAWLGSPRISHDRKPCT